MQSCQWSLWYITACWCLSRFIKFARLKLTGGHILKCANIPQVASCIESPWLPCCTASKWLRINGDPISRAAGSNRLKMDSRHIDPNYKPCTTGPPLPSSTPTLSVGRTQQDRTLGLYRTLGLSNPRIIEPSDFRALGLSIHYLYDLNEWMNNYYTSLGD